jgi:hypothetical protein
LATLPTVLTACETTPPGCSAVLATPPTVLTGVVHGREQPLDHLRVVIEQADRGADDLAHVVQPHDQERARLHAVDVDLHLLDAGVDAGRELDQLADARIERDEVLDQQPDLVDRHVGDVQQHVGRRVLDRVGRAEAARDGCALRGRQAAVHLRHDACVAVAAHDGRGALRRRGAGRGGGGSTTKARTGVRPGG